MNILVLGGGGREHALAWKIKQSPLCHEVYCSPGNPAMKRDHILTTTIHRQDLIEWARNHKIELIVIGPEALLVEGYADELRTSGFSVVGCSQNASQLESSKIFAKEFMREFNLPTAPYSVCESYERVASYAQGPFPLVLKYDALAAGKGVVVAHNSQDVLDFSDKVFLKTAFGTTKRVLIESFIKGTEISYIGLCDTANFIALSSATDYKRACDGDTGANTGGMGSISPSPYMTPAIQRSIETKIIQPCLRGLKIRNVEFRGALFVGIMLDEFFNPWILEFNVRFGDPETQAIMLRLKSDLLPMLIATASGSLSDAPTPEWSENMCVYVVGATRGYPDNPVLGDTIEGLDSISSHSHLFGAGISEKNGTFLTCGGRVLGIGALGQSQRSARTQAYKDLRQLNWSGQTFRTDIGKERI